MNKELTPLEAFEKTLDIVNSRKQDDNLQCYIEIIETALTNYALVVPHIDKLCELAKTNDIDEMVCNVETALKENKTLKERIILNKASFNMAKQQYKKKLQALKIIKEKKWLVEEILNAFYPSENKYDLLIEVLL